MAPKKDPNKPSTQNITPFPIVRNDEVLELELDDDDDEDFDLSEWDAVETVNLFLDAWSEKDYTSAYELLASDSLLREGLTQDKWVKSRQKWAREAQPANSKFDIVYAIADDDEEFEEDEEEALIVPDRITDLEDGPTEVTAFWSLELRDTALEATIKELPTATMSYKETGRRWFWTNYTLVEEDEGWRIQDMQDEGANALSRSPSELGEKMQELATSIQELTQIGDLDELEDEDEDEEERTLEGDEDEDEAEDELSIGGLEGLIDDELDELLHDIVEITTQAMHCCDGLIAQAPDDIASYELAYSQAIAIQEWERAAAYLELMAQRFEEPRGDTLRNLTLVLASIAAEYDEQGDQERGEHFLALAEKRLRDSIEVDNALLSHILLAQMLIAQNSRLDEAEAAIREAQAQAQDENDEMLIEQSLGHLASARNEYEPALRHYRRAAELNPDQPGIWFCIGRVQRRLQDYKGAEENLRKAIEVEPDEVKAYIELGLTYLERDKLDEAFEVLRDGFDIAPEDPEMQAALAIAFIHGGDLRSAKQVLDQLEEYGENVELVQTARKLYAEQKAGKRPSSKGGNPGSRSRPSQGRKKRK